MKDLARLYKEFNEKLFDNSLPNDIKLYYDDLSYKYCGLTTVYYYDYDTKDIEVQIDKNMSYYDTITTLLHEMIHVWQVSIGRDMDHGATFRNKAKQIYTRMPKVKCAAKVKSAKDII